MTKKSLLALSLMATPFVGVGAHALYRPSPTVGDSGGKPYIRSDNWEYDKNLEHFHPQDIEEKKEKLWMHAEKLNGRKYKRGLWRNTEKTITLIDGGIEKVMTSNDPVTVQKLQDKMGTKKHLKGVEVSVENLDNGVRVTYTSDDPAILESLQTHRKGKRK